MRSQWQNSHSAPADDDSIVFQAPQLRRIRQRVQVVVANDVLLEAHGANIDVLGFVRRREYGVPPQFVSEQLLSGKFFILVSVQLLRRR